MKPNSAVGAEDLEKLFKRVSLVEKNKPSEANIYEILMAQVQAVANLGVIVFDIVGGTWLGSRSIYKIMGVDEKEERTISGWKKLVHKNYIEELKKYFVSETLKKHRKVSRIFKIVRKNDKEERWIQANGFLNFDKKGNLIQVVGTLSDITEFKSIEAKLIESENKYRKLYEVMPDAFVVIDLMGKFVEVNEAFLRLTGYSRNELLNITNKDITPKKWHKIEDEIYLKRILIKGDSGVYEKEYERRDGSVIQIEIRAYLVKDRKGKPISMCGLVRNISERKKIEQKINKDKEIIDTILSNTRSGIALTSSKLNFIMVNPFFRKMMGYSLNDLKKMTFKELTYPEDISESEIELQKLAIGKIDSFSLEKRYVTKNNKIIWGLTNVSVVRDKLGKNQYYIVSIDDITERKVFENKIEEKNTQILIEKQKQEAILRGIGDAVVVLDNENKIILVNKAAEKLTEYKDTDLLGSLLGDKIKFISESWDAGVGKKQKVVNNDEEAVLLNTDTYLLTKLQNKIFVGGVKSVIKDLSGSKIGSVFVFRDVTDERELNRIKTEFVSVASHQLRTPLTGIKWFVDLLMMNINDISKDEILDYIRKIGDSNDRLISLINDLLYVSRIEGGKLRLLDTHRVSIYTILDYSVKDQEAIRKEKNISIVGLDKIPEGLVLEGDETQLIQIFSNLIGNSIKYSPNNTDVTVSVNKKNESLVVTVTDSGVGILSSQEDKVFQKFFRGDNVVKSTSGTGLGLYVVKNLVENHKGKIWFVSKPGIRTSFSVELPCVSGKK